MIDYKGAVSSDVKFKFYTKHQILLQSHEFSSIQRFFKDVVVEFEVKKEHESELTGGSLVQW